MLRNNKLPGLAGWYAVALLMALAMFGSSFAEGQTYTVLHSFSGRDGSFPTTTLLMDRAGNLYGSTQGGGSSGEGTVFELKHAGSGWIVNSLYSFHGPHGGDGAIPVNMGGLVFGPDGAIYGTTEEGGIFSGSQSLGTVFRLQPPPNRCQSVMCSWSDSIVHEFAGSPGDGAMPTGNVVFDSTGNIYGTTTEIGASGGVFKMTRTGDGWSESLIPSIGVGELDSGLAVDAAGNLYGASRYGPGQKGSIFQLAPSGSGYTLNILYQFTGGTDGEYPVGGVTLDAAGNVYGTTSFGGSLNGGTVFELTPSANGWTFHLLCSFGGSQGSQSSLTLDAHGNLYGTTEYDGRYGGGSAFEVSYNGSGWTCTNLYSFEQSGLNGVAPIGGLVVDASGNIYGTTPGGGANGGGVVFEITP